MSLFRPLKDWMILEACELDTPSDIILPDSLGEDKKREMVLSFIVKEAGPECKDYGVKVGDEIIIEGVVTPCFKYKGNDYPVGQAQNVCFIVNN